MVPAKYKDKRVVWILGAGFSRSLGGPLLDDLLSERGQAEARARVGDCFGNIHNFYWSNLRGHRRQDGPTYWHHAEEFLDFIQSMIVENSIRRKIFNKSDPVELHRLAVLAVASECLFAREASAESENWDPYIQWSDGLGGNDTIVSFNYDIVLDHLYGWNEGSLLRIQHPFKDNHDLADGYANVLKLHGALNWFEDDGIVVDPVTDVIEILQAGRAPVIGTPGPSKAMLKGTVLYPLWYHAVEALKEAHVVVFMGYRFPPSDSQARSTLLGALRENRSKHLRIHTVLGPRTHDDDTVRLGKLLEHTLQGAGRIPESAVGVSRSHKRYEVIQQPLYVEDFLTVIHPRELYGSSDS